MREIDRSGARVRLGFSGLVPLICLLGVGGCIGESREQEIGDEMASTVNRQIALVQNPLLNRYISSIGNALAAVSDRPELDYHFYLINSRTVNAFALPGGHIYVTRGLIERTRTGQELAGVLAHEIGHVVKRHGVEKLQRQLRTGSLVNVMYGIILGGEPELLKQNALRMAGLLWTADHSRSDEEEADQLAVEYLIRAGIDPEGMVSLLEHLAAEEQADSTSRTQAWFSSHPLTGSRLAETREDVRIELANGRNSAVAGSIEFQTHGTFLRLVGALPPPPDSID